MTFDFGSDEPTNSRCTGLKIHAPGWDGMRLAQRIADIHYGHARFDYGEVTFTDEGYNPRWNINPTCNDWWLHTDGDPAEERFRLNTRYGMSLGYAEALKIILQEAIGPKGSVEIC